MKSLFVLMLVSATSFAGILPEGTYTGLGDYEIDKGAPGTYQSVTTVGKEGSLTFEFRWGSEVKQVKLKLEGTSEKFDVLDEGGKVGSGECDGVRCDYAVKKEGLELRETLVFTNNKLLRFGTKKANGDLYTWYQRELK